MSPAPGCPGDWSYTTAEGADGSLDLHVAGRMDARSAAPMLREFRALLRRRRPAALRVDLSRVAHLDDYGATVLAELRRCMAERSGQFAAGGASGPVAATLALLDYEAVGRFDTARGRAGPDPVTRLGAATLERVAALRELVGFVGEVCLALFHVLRHPRALRVEDTLVAAYRTGVQALPIVSLISFLLGLIMAFMSAVQLKQFGANIYVASLVGLAMCRELGPIMTAIIVAGRSGSAFAAEIGTMRVSEEVDALTTMGFDPVVFLAVPRLLAAVVVVPILTLFSDGFAILGGQVVGVAMLDLTAGAYLAQTIKTLSVFHVFLGVAKSLVFAVLIAWVGCLRGFQVRGGAASVGSATTAAVVDGIFLIIVVDALFAVVLRYWG